VLFTDRYKLGKNHFPHWRAGLRISNIGILPAFIKYI
jgi:hypothetical protein